MGGIIKIISRLCHTATGGAAHINENGRTLLHQSCPGECIHDLAVVKCECGCHAQSSMSRHFRNPEGEPNGFPRPKSLPHGVVVSGEAPRPARANRNRPAQAPDGRCEHCGAPCGPRSRFAPGHDAKLKSELTTEAREGNYKSYAELVLRKWPTPWVVVPTAERGEALADEWGYELVERRNRVRKGYPVSS